MTLVTCWVVWALDHMTFKSETASQSEKTNCPPATPAMGLYVVRIVDPPLLLVVLPPPQAATANKPTHASAIARKRVPNCIRVLPLWIDPAAFFPEPLETGARVRPQQVLLT